MARNLKVVGEEGEVVFIEDATATFKKHEASPYDAEIVHGVHMESLREFASIRKTQSVIDQWRLWSEER